VQRKWKLLKLKLEPMSLILIIIFTVICIVSLYFAATVEERMELYFISRGGYGENAVYLRLNKECLNSRDLIKLVEDCEYSDFKIMQDERTDDSLNSLRQVYIKGESDSPPIISGRYFNEKDFNRGKAFAVVGSNRKEEIVKKDNELYIQAKGKLFKVIGVTGYHIESKFDDMVIVNMDAAFFETDNNRYILDAYSGRSKGLSSNIYYSLKEAASEKIYDDAPSPITMLDIQSEGIDRLLQEIVNLSTIYLLLMICFMLSSVAISFEWISKQRRKIAVKRLLGWSDHRLKLDIYKAYLFFAISGIALGVVIMSILGFEITRIESIFVLIVLSIIFGLLITIPPVQKMLKVSVTEVLR